MKKVGCFILATAALVLVAVLPAYAQGFAFGGSRGHHGTHHFHSGIEFFFGVRPPVWWWGWGSYYPYYPYDLSPHYYYSDDSHSYYTYNPSDPYFPYFYVYPGQMVGQQVSPADTRQGRPAAPHYR